MRVTGREFIQVGAAVGGAVALKVQPALGTEGGNPMSPAINARHFFGWIGNAPLQELAAFGYRGLELYPSDLKDADLWRPKVEKAGFGLVSMNALPELRPYLTGSLSDAVERNRRATLDRLLRLLEQMRQMQIPFLVVAPSRLAENYQTPEEARALLLASLRELADAGDTTILLEAVPFRMFGSSKEIAALLDEVAKPNVAAALDVGHGLLNGERPPRAAKALGARLRYVQVHDADISAGTPRLDRHLPPGEGSLKPEEVRAAVADLPFAVGITPVGDPVAAARQALQWLG